MNTEHANGRLLLVVGDDNNLAKYRHYLADVISPDLASSLTEAYQSCLKICYDLVLIDLKLSLGFGRLQIERLNSLVNPPPIFKIRPRGNQVEIILPEKRTTEELITFIKNFFQQLKEDNASSINLRKYVRYRSILRVTIERGQGSEPMQANTLNISQGGLFITTTLPFESNEMLSLSLYDAIDKPIQATVKVAWARPWEVPHQLPGIGACFQSFAREEDRYALMEYIIHHSPALL